MLTKEQKIWKGENYSAKNGISWLFRQLVTELDPNNPRSKPSYNEVKRVVQRSKTLHYDCLGFLQEKFQNRVVSNCLEIFWPAKNPDQIHCIFFWGLSEGSVDVDAKPKSLKQLKKVVELCAKNVSRETEIIRKLQKKNHFMHDK